MADRFSVIIKSLFTRSRWTLPRSVRRSIAVLMTLLALFVLGRMIYHNWTTLRTFDWEIHFLPLIGSFFAYAIYIALATFTWGRILQSMGSTTSWRDHFRIYYISTLANRLPVPLGQVAGRLALYDEQTTKKTIAFASGLELLLIGLAGLTLGVILLPKATIYLNWWISIPTILIGLTIVHPKVLKNILFRLKIEGAFELRYANALSWLFFYLLVWILGGIAIFLLVASFYPLNVIAIPDVVGAWCLAGSVSILLVFLPFGLGIRELTLGLLLLAVLPPAFSAIAAILSRIFFTLFEIIFAGIASLFKD